MTHPLGVFMMYTIRATSSRTLCNIMIKAPVKKYTVYALFTESSKYYTVQITIPTEEKHVEGCVFTPKNKYCYNYITFCILQSSKEF